MSSGDYDISGKSDNGDENPLAQAAEETSQVAPKRDEMPKIVAPDPLISMFTRPAPPSGTDTKTINAPLLGEIPVDGSLFVLIPAAVIGILGFIMSFVVAYNSRDVFIQALVENNPPPPRQQVISDECRGICSDQAKSLEGLSDFMGSLRKN